MNNPTIKREAKFLATAIGPDGDQSVIIVATDGTIWGLDFLWPSQWADKWRELPSLPEAPNPHYQAQVS